MCNSYHGRTKQVNLQTIECEIEAISPVYIEIRFKQAEEPSHVESTGDIRLRMEWNWDAETLIVPISYREAVQSHKFSFPILQSFKETLPQRS